MADIEQLEFDSDAILKRYDADNRLESYYHALLYENESINLVSRETSITNLKILAADSLFPLEQLGSDSTNNYLDIGSGGGFPAVPLIINLKPANAILFERREKKSQALGRILKKLELSNASVLTQNFEEFKTNDKFDLITIRLVKLNDRILKKSLEILSDSGKIIYYSTPEFSLDKYHCSSVTKSYKSGSSTNNKSYSVISKK